MTEMITTSDNRVRAILTASRKRVQNEREKDQNIRENWKKVRQLGFGFAEGVNPPSVLDYEEGRMLHEILVDGAWKGQRCFIVGGGESLKGFDFSKLKNELVIGINRAFEKIDCTINFAMDHMLYEWITNGKLGDNARNKFDEFKGIPVWMDSVGYEYPQGVYIINQIPKNNMGHSLKDGIRSGSNSGFGALGIAICLGANPIYLLGFDMEGKEGKQVNWHNGYPERQDAKVYKVFRNDFNNVAQELETKNIKVINLNPKSELKCFEFGSIKDIDTPSYPIITSYYTKNTPYETQVEHLKTTLKRFNLDNEVVGIKDQGDWHKNTYYKPNFILSMLNKHKGRPVVFVDADAKIRANPILFSELDCDFACHFKLEKELLSGTLYFGNTEKSRWLVRKWIEENKLHPKTHMPQKNLRSVFDKYKNEINWKPLPVEYCMIHDSSARYKVNPVVEHFQLSRQYKDSKKRAVIMKRSLSDMKKLCKGKKIVLLGNADSVLRRKRKIDSFDIVGRMNRGDPRGKEEFIGSRTDILFLSTGVSKRGVQAAYNNPKFIVWMTECHRLAHPWVLRNAIQNPKMDWRELHKELGINPSTGMMALNFIIKYLDFKSLTIYGFNFFKTKSWYNTRPDDGKKHSGKKEEKKIMEMIAKHKNVKIIL